eukprot:scaffold2563_cov124-Cylindrotheca_fusiformis.AAC.11
MASNSFKMTVPSESSMAFLRLVCCLLVIFSPAVKALRGQSEIFLHRNVKENKRTPPPAIEPTFRPTFNPTADPSSNPTRQPSLNPTVQPILNPTMQPILNPTMQPILNPTMQPILNPTVQPILNPTVQPTVIAPRSLTHNLMTFSLIPAEPVEDKGEFQELLERFLLYSMQGGIPSLESVKLQTVSESGRYLQHETSRTKLKYQGTATVTDLAVGEPLVQNAQIAVLEETDYFQGFLVHSDDETVLRQVQVGNRKAILIQDFPAHSDTKESLGGGVIGIVIAGIFAAAIILGLAVWHQKKKTPPPPPYLFEGDSSLSVDESIDLAKFRTIETETCHVSPLTSCYYGKKESSNYMIHENQVDGGMEIVATEVSKFGQVAQFISSPLRSYGGFPAALTPTRCRSATSSVSSCSSLNPPCVSRPRLNSSLSKTSRLGRDPSCGTPTSTERVTPQSKAESFPASSFQEDVADDEFAVFDERDTVGGRNPSPHNHSAQAVHRQISRTTVAVWSPSSHAHSAQTVPHRNSQLVRVKSEEFQRHHDPEKARFDQPSIQTSKSEDQFGSDSSAASSTLENILNPVQNPTAANNNAIEVFVDGSTDGSDSEDESIPPCEEDKDWMQDIRGSSGGCLSNAQSFSSEPSDQRRDLAVPKSNQRTQEYLYLEDSCSNDLCVLPVVSPASSNSRDARSPPTIRGNGILATGNTLSNGDLKSVRGHPSFDHSQDGSNHSDTDMFDDNFPAPKEACTESASVGSQGAKSVSSLVSVDSASHFDPVFIAELQQERRRVKNATRKLHAEMEM